jgi:hypothetical protein
VAPAVITIIGGVFGQLAHSWNGHRINVAELRSRQEGPIALTLDHSENVGQVLTLTRVKGGAVYAIAVSEGCDALLETDAPIYFSPKTDTRIDGSDGRFVELALTFQTARVAPKPVVVKAGDIREPSDRNRWALRGLVAELVPRAVDEIRCRPKDGPIHIHDLELEKAIERENNRRASYVAESITRNDQGRLVPPQMRSGWKPGDLEWSMAVGKVLSVR